MALISQIVTDAYQLNNLVALSVIPSSDELQKGLRYLNRIFRSSIGVEVGDKVSYMLINDSGAKIKNPWFRGYTSYTRFAENQTIPKNTFVISNKTTAQTYYVNPYPEDGERLGFQDKTGNLSSAPAILDGNGFTIEGSDTVTLNENSQNVEWFFRADLGDWVKVSPLGLADVFPLPEDFEEYYITMLNIRLNATEGVAVDSQFEYIMRTAKKRLYARYRQDEEMPSELGLIRLGLYDKFSRFEG